ncbi:MAG: hypothetical protein HOP28_11845 [Gemmatimonadales bacterium]|nr:hypothetical protein [Gemmatimonadales bacterium]
MPTPLVPRIRGSFACHAALAATLLALPSCGSSDTSSPPPPPASSPGPPAEFTIQYIERLPRIDFVPGSLNPKVEGWPAVGQVVTWRANVKNWFPMAKTVAVRWLLDGAEVRRADITIPAGGVGTADYQWPWTFTRHLLTFVVDPENRIAEEEELNNRLAIYTNALTAAFYVEQGFYNYFRLYQHVLPLVHSTSFEDWAQRQISRYNDLFAAAIFPETPQGVLDRYRLDRIYLVPDGSIVNDRNPDPADRTVDVSWGFPRAQVDAAEPYRNLTDAGDRNQFVYSGYLQHELGHRRNMIDVYSFAVYDGLPGHNVDVLEGGVRIADSPFLPSTSLTFNGFPGRMLLPPPVGLMSQTWTVLDRYSAVMFNRAAGRRRVDEPFGVYMNDLATDNRVLLTDQAGTPLGGATVSVYRAKRSPDLNQVVYGRRYAGPPDVTVTADAAGGASLGRNPWGGTEQIFSDITSNAVLLLRVAWGGKVGFTFLPVLEFNILYQTGARAVASVPVSVVLR